MCIKYVMFYNLNVSMDRSVSELALVSPHVQCAPQSSFVLSHPAQFKCQDCSEYYILQIWTLLNHKVVIK